MRIQYTHNLSLMLEDLSRRDDSAFTKCLQVCLYQTLADRLWTPFKVVCFNPFITLLVVLVVYIVFCIIYTPLWLASLLITSYGSFILFLVFINYLANTISRAIAFAGCNVSVQKQISSEFFRRIVAFLEMVAVQISDFTAILLLGASGQIPFHEMPPMDVKFEEIVTRAGSLPTLSGHFRESLNFLTSQLMVTPEEYTVMNQLCTTIDEQIAALNTLQPLAISYITALETSRRSNNAANRGRNGAQGQQQAAAQQVPRGTQELFKAASQCLKISKALKIAVDSSKPPVTSEEDSGIIGKIKSVLSFNQGLEGCEKLTFPYMRCLLQQRFKVERISLVGCDKNKIDGVIFPASALLNVAPATSAGGQAAASPSEPCAMSACGLVMFCSPNAGFYEGMSQSDLNSSWLGMYLKMGYDVCMFNYRGYGLSTGCPNPHGIKQDACQLYTHLQRTRHPKRIILHGESIGGMVACHVARHMPVDVLVCDRTFSTLDATAARLMGRWAGLGLKYCTLWSTNIVRDYLAVTCPKIVLQDPDDEIIANLASLKNGVAMRVVLGDLSWKILPEPRDYAYAHFLGEELPNKDKENTMIEEAGDVTKKLSEDFITHFYACLADIARRASAAGKPKARRPRAALAPVAATPRRVSHRSGHSSAAAEAADKSASAGSGASSSVNSSTSRRSTSGGNSNNNVAAEAQVQSPGDDGYSSHDSRRSSKEFFNEDDADEGADSGSDASAKGLILDMMGMRSTSNDNWSLDQHGIETEPTTLGDVESSGAKRGTISPRPVLRQNSGSVGNAAADSALRVPTTRKEWLEQFCSTQMRDPVVGSPGGADGPQSPQSSKAALQAPAVSPAMKAWAAVGRIDGGSGQLLGQALSSGIEGVRAWICSLLVWSPNSTKDFSLPKGCTDIPAALDDLNILISEVHPTELQQDRAVLFLKRALLCLQRRRDAQIFYKPPLSIMLRGAISFERECVSDSSAADGMETGEQSEVRHEPAPGSSGVAGGTAQRTHTQAGVAPDSALGVMVSKLAVQAGACLCAAKTFLSSNSYASLDMCHDLDDLHHAGASGADCSAGNVSVNAVTSSAHSIFNGFVCSTGPAHSAQLPYVGNIIALHCGHNGWPAQTELAALQSFFVKNSIA